MAQHSHWSPRRRGLTSSGRATRGGLVAAILLVSACTIRPDAYDIDGQDVEVVFFHTGDIHSRLVPYELDVGETDEALGLLQQNAPFGGIARLSALVRQERRDNERFAYLETGDGFQGAPIFNVFEGEAEFKALTAMGLDAFAIGNHEFDNGAEHLVRMAQNHANFPMLAVNYLLEDPTFVGSASTAEITQPYTILNLKGLRVGVIGLGNLSSMRSVFKGGNSQGITPLNTVEILQSYVDYLRPQVDLMVSIGHIGYHDDLEYIPRVEGLDIVFGGHLHIALDPPTVLQDCDVARLRRELDRYDCRTPEKLRQVQRACERKCDNDFPEAPAEAEACRAGCPQEALDRCAQEEESFRYAERRAELNADIARLERRGCHPRDVILVHSGAFLKYAGRLQVTVRQCTRLEQADVCMEFDESGQCLARRPRRCVGRNGGRNDWEVLAHKYTLIPIDKRLPDDPMMLRMMEPYVLQLNRQELLTQVIGFASERVRRFSSGAGDSAVGNMVANAMLERNQVWADFALTNSLGIRADMVPGPVDGEQMINVFPFENSVTVMFLSGYEVQEMMDFVTQRSTNRGCQSQAQVSGLTAVLNCGGCPGDGGNTCIRENYDGEACAQRVTVGGSGRPCKTDADCARCVLDFPEADDDVRQSLAFSCAGKVDQPMGEICTGQQHPEFSDFTRCWTPIGVREENGQVIDACSRSYKLATNNYIAGGGSGFQVLARNTTQNDLKIPMRQATVDFMRSMPACGEVPTRSGRQTGARTFLLPADEERHLGDLEQLARKGDWAAVNDGMQALAEGLQTRRREATGTTIDDKLLRAGLTNYLRCTDLDCHCRVNKDCADRFGSSYLCNRGMCERDGVTRCAGLASRLVVECREYQATNLDRCEALARVHAAMRCITLPCINAKEDGRLQRIFSDSSGSPNPFEPWPE